MQAGSVTQQRVGNNRKDKYEQHTAVEMSLLIQSSAIVSLFIYTMSPWSWFLNHFSCLLLSLSNVKCQYPPPSWRYLICPIRDSALPPNTIQLTRRGKGRLVIVECVWLDDHLLMGIGFKIPKGSNHKSHNRLLLNRGTNRRRWPGRRTRTTRRCSMHWKWTREGGNGR